MIFAHFQGELFHINSIQFYAPTNKAEEAEIEWFQENLHDLLELTPKKSVLFIKGEWNAKVGNQDIPGVMGKFSLGEQNEAGQTLKSFAKRMHSS